MVQKTFGIYNPETTEEQALLYIELGKTHVAAWTKSLSGAVSSFELFEYEPEMNPVFDTVFREVKSYSKLLDGRYSDVRVIWENSECLLVPAPFYEERVSSQYLNIVFGNTLHSEVAGYKSEETQTAAVFRIPKTWKQNVQLYFPAATFEHKYLGLYRHFSADRQAVYTLFYRNHFILIVAKQQKIQLMQTFDYQTPEDVLYYILNTCNQYGLDYETTPVRVAGLIDFSSALYDELVKYLPDVAVDTLPGSQLGAAFADQPVHFFVPFFKTLK